LESGSEGFFSMKTELKLILKDCRNDEVFVTEWGESRAKDYEQGYKEALEDAMASFNAVNYEYNGNEGVNKEQMASSSDTDSTEDSNLLTDLQGNKYNKDDTGYEIRKIEAGYLMVEAETGDREALMNLTEDETILFNGKDMSGTASINDEGDVVVEYFDDEKGE